MEKYAVVKDLVTGNENEKSFSCISSYKKVNRFILETELIVTNLAKTKHGNTEISAVEIDLLLACTDNVGHYFNIQISYLCSTLHYLSFNMQYVYYYYYYYESKDYSDTLH